MKSRFFFLLLVMLPFSIAAQTPEEILEQAVHKYNAMRDFEDELKPGKVTDADIAFMLKERTDGIALLDKVIASGNFTEAKTARYFKANFSYELGFVYGMVGKNKEAYDVLSQIKSEYEYFDASQFPLKYKYETKNYAINYDNFGPTKAEYYTGMAEICANLSKSDESLEWSRKALSFSYTTDWYRYISQNKVMEVKKKKDEWDREMLDMALGQMQTYQKLDTSYKRTVKDNNYPTQKTSYKNIKTTLEKHPELSQGGYYYGKAAQTMAQLGDHTNAVDAYSKAILDGYGDGNRSFLFEAADEGFSQSNNALALLATDRLADKFSSSLSCSEWQRVVNNYDKLGESSKKSSAQQKLNDCEKKAAEEERRRKKQQRRQAMDFQMYAGFYPGPMICRFAHYRDYGFVAGIGTGKMIVEVSYKIINNNHHFYDDLFFRGVQFNNGSAAEQGALWNGTRTHLALKFTPKNAEDGFYVGPMVEMVKRNFNAMWTNLVDANTGALLVQDRKYYPTDQSFNLFLNFGMQQAGKHIFYDMFMGIGPYFGKYDIGPTSSPNLPAYTLSNEILANRKPSRVGVTMRMGITIGFSTKK